MIEVKYLIAITDSKFGEIYLEFFKNKGINASFYELCLGTSKQKIMDVMGLTHKEKVMFQFMVGNDELPELLKGIEEIIAEGGIGSGIAFTVPVDAIGGNTAKNYLLGEKPVKKGEDKMKKNESKCALIITLVDKGNTDLVMDAAREAGASGGTVVKAKGTGTEIAKVFGMTISEEKDMIYIVCPREKRNDIMYAIMEKAGVKTDAHGITFSLPVDNVLGISALEKLFN